MNLTRKHAIAGIIIIFVIIVGSVILIILSPKDTNTAAEVTPSPTITQRPTGTQEPEYALYEEFTTSSLADTTERRRVLFFYASWCPTCRPADADFKTNLQTLPRDIAIIRVNYNDPETSPEEKALAATYNITYQHTFVQIDARGKELARWTGGRSRELLEVIK